MNIRLLAAAAAATLLAAGCKTQAPSPTPVAAPDWQASRLRSAASAPPVVAVLGLNRRTEVTDFIIPYAILARTGAAEVIAVAPRDEPIELYPAMRVRPQATLQAFDARFPGGADYVIVPAMRPRADPQVIGWLRAQAARGARIVAVCNGSLTVARAGLLKGRRATSHWDSREALRKAEPSVRYVLDRRYVADGPVITSTGVSSSIPLALALAEALAGRNRAAAIARELGVAGWDDRHDSAAFQLKGRHMLTAVRDRLPWRRETLTLVATAGADDVALALAADAFARTPASVIMSSVEGRKVQLRSGLTLLPDAVAGAGRAERLAMPVRSRGRSTLEATLDSVAARYGIATAGFVALQLEQRWTPPQRSAVPGARAHSARARPLPAGATRPHPPRPTGGERA